MIDILQNELDRLLQMDDSTPRLYLMLDYYYEHYIDNICDDEKNGGFKWVPDDFKKPVDSRESGLGEAMTILLEKGHDVNEEIDGQDFCDNALILAVQYGDRFMVEYLLDHGADCRKWPAELMKEVDEPDNPEYNFYLEDIDIHLDNTQCDEETPDLLEFHNNLFKIAVMLAKAGNLWPFHGTVLKVDEHDVIVRTVQYKIPSHYKIADYIERTIHCRY